MRVAIVGGGAGGFFAALSVKEHYPEADVTIYEKSKKVLSKVKVSGGGRCNVTNGCTDINVLAKAYPRGEKKLKQAFYTFSTQHTMDWFEERGVALTTQDDGCVFPVSQDSQTIIDCFLNNARKLGISIITSAGVTTINQVDKKIELAFATDLPNQLFDKVILATGGSPKRKGLEWLENLGHKIEEPVPSLFTFNMPNEPVKDLMGIVVENTITKVQGTKLKSDGPLLITHWGMSGPSILKLSAFGARTLSELGYDFKLQVNWVNEVNSDVVTQEVKKIITEHTNKQLANIRPFYIPTRLWHYLLTKVDLPHDRKWHEIGKKGTNKIVNILTNDVYQVNGKTTFKEEFVTCGGISLDSINFKTMESKSVPNLYFTGELLDIDGITGGYNFQGAWTTGYIAGKLA